MGVNEKAVWAPLDNDILVDLEMSEQFKSVHAFHLHYGAATEDGEFEDMIGEAPALAKFVPWEQGVEHVLPDGVSVQVRMELVSGRYEAQWKIPDRKIDIPDELDIMKVFPEFIKQCARLPHRVLTMTPAARGTFLPLQTLANVRVKQARDLADADTGAEYGIAPWKLGQLSAALLMWDILWKDVVPMFREGPWLVQPDHVRRASKLLRILDAIRLGLRNLGAVPAQNAEGVISKELDTNAPGCPEVVGTTTSEIARRMLCSAGVVSRDGDAIQCKSHTVHAYRLFTKGEVTKRALGRSASASSEPLQGRSPPRWVGSMRNQTVSCSRYPMSQTAGGRVR